MSTVSVRGIDLYFEEYGAGPHLIVAHGLLGSVAALDSFGERPRDIAARGLHVVAYDARGHGRSGYTRRIADYRYAAHAEDLRGLLDALGIDRTSVYGGSMGAGTAIIFALAHPERVDRLILQSPPPFSPDDQPARRVFGGLATLYQLLGSRLTARVVSALPSMRRSQRQSPARNLRDFFASQRRAAVVPAIRGVLSGPRQMPIERFGEIGQPALVLTHPHDAIHPLRSGEILHERMPHAKLAVAPTTTYWQDNPDVLTDVIAAFVKGEPLAQGLPVKQPHQHGEAAGAAR